MRNQLLADLAYAADPEELAANQDYEHDRQENKIERPFDPIGDEPESKKNQPTEEEKKAQLMSSDEAML